MLMLISDVYDPEVDGSYWSWKIAHEDTPTIASQIPSSDDDQLLMENTDDFPPETSMIEVRNPSVHPLLSHFTTLDPDVKDPEFLEDMITDDYLFLVGMYAKPDEIPF